MTLTRVWIPSGNNSSRGGSGVRLIVVHTMEGFTGANGAYDCAKYFQTDCGASSHVCIDNNRGKIWECVNRSNKAWTQCNCNPYCVAAEQSGYASWSRDYWLNNRGNELHNTADWIAEEAKKFGIPIRALSSSEAQGGAAGVCQHSQLGSYGCGHSDCGPGYPMDKVIEWAGGSSSTAPPPSGGSGGQTAPAFPYPSDHYIGQPSSDSKCHSGCYGGSDNTNCRTWQNQMAHRGWSISVDGCYGNQSEAVCRQFQSEKGLGVDGLVGPNTWKTSWTAPIS
jgi:peptidoglycan hydrolase-like protein with peptidoglycan-binding domain